MKNNDFLRKLSSLFFFDRWHPEVAIRYLPVVELLKEDYKEAKILEVGSGGLGIVPYLKKKVTGLDTYFSPPYHPNLIKMVGSATKIPFTNNSFDVIFSLDMMEHLSKEKRGLAVKEMLRTAKKIVIIGMPCGELAFNQDKKLNEEFEKKHGKGYHFLKEQIDNGLPEQEDIEKQIYDSGNKLNKKLKVSVCGNENLGLRNFLMKGWMTKNIIVNFIYRKLMLFAIPVFRIFEKEPYYRRIFYIKIIN